MDEILKPTEVELTKVDVVGELFYHIFQYLDGNEIEIETTEEDYRQLAQLNHKNPILKGAIWKYSYSDYKYNTVSGRMEENTYADNGDGYRLMLSGIDDTNIKKDEIIDNKISQDKIDSLIVEVNSLPENKIIF